MVSQDFRSRKSPRLSRPRNGSVNGMNNTGHTDDGWEDVEVIRSPSPASTTSRRRGRRPTRTEFVASQPGSTRRQPLQQPQPTRRRYFVEFSESGSDAGELPPRLPPPPPVESHEEQPATDLVKEYATPIFGYTLKVVADAFHFNRRIFSLALGMTMLWLLFSMMKSQLVFFTQPICSLPIVSRMIPFCHWDAFKDPPIHTSAGRPVRWADYPNLVDLQTRTFDQLLDESVGNKRLASEVKKAEMASNDLITLVRASDLRSKDQIADRLSKFVDDARGTGRSLHSLGSKINGAVDSIATLNDYALQTIEASKTPPSLMARVLPFSLSTNNPTKAAVMETFLMSMDNIVSQVVRLREEAEISMDHLMRLEEHLIVLHEITHRDNKQLKAAQEEVLAELWTWLGANRVQLRKMNLDLDLLRNVDRYRKKALAHVVATLQTLHTLDADMEELRTRVAAPDLLGDKIPIEVHIKSIKAGVERLKEGQMRASLKQGEAVARILEVGA